MLRSNPRVRELAHLNVEAFVPRDWASTKRRPFGLEGTRGPGRNGAGTPHACSPPSKLWPKGLVHSNQTRVQRYSNPGPHGLCVLDRTRLYQLSCSLVGMRVVHAHNKTLAVLGSSSAARVFDSNGPDPGDKSSMLRCASANAAWASTITTMIIRTRIWFP